VQQRASLGKYHQGIQIVTENTLYIYTRYHDLHGVFSINLDFRQRFPVQCIKFSIYDPTVDVK
jgi:hypothetical protein